MQKLQIVEALNTAGVDNAEEVYETSFRGIHYTHHVAVLEEIVKDLNNASQEIEPMSPSNTPKSSTITGKLELTTWKDGNPRSIIATPSNWDGETVHNVRDRYDVGSAITAMTDYVHFAEQSGYTNLEPGLHFRYSVEEIVRLKNVTCGYITDDYKGNRMIAKPIEHGVGRVKYQFGRYVTLKIGYDAKWRDNNKVNGIEQRTIRKHGFLDIFLSGVQLKIQMGAVRFDYRTAAFTTLSAEDKDEAYKAYREDKHDAGVKEEATQTGNNLIGKLNGDTHKEKVADAKKSLIKLYVSGEIVEDATMDDIPSDAMVHVKSRNGGTVAHAFYEGKTSEVKMYLGWIKDGCTFHVTTQ